MKAVRLEGIGSLALREVERPTPSRGEIVVRVEASGVCGTDRHLLHGEFPCRPPVTLGHEFCGIVEEVGHGVQGLAPGMRVTGDPNIACGLCARCREGRVNLCEALTAIGIHRDGALAEYVALPALQAHRLPDDIDPAHGALCEPLACCLHGFDRAGVRPGDSVVVLGGGVIGLLVVQLARLAGAGAIVLSTRQASRRALALSVGATDVVDPSASEPIAAISGAAGVLPGGADVVFECAGVPDTMRQMCAMTRAGGTAVMLGVMAQGETVPFEPFDILFREISLIGSFVNPFTHARAARLISSGVLRLDGLVTRRVALDDIPGVITAPAAPGDVRVLYVAGAA